MEKKGEYALQAVRCLGIDPGIANCGIAIVSRMVIPGSNFKLLHSDRIRTPAKHLYGARLGEIANVIEGLIDEHKIDVVGVETVYHNKNVSSSTTTAGVIGVIELIAHRAGCGCMQIRPQAVKAAVTGRGKAAKGGVMNMVNKILNSEIDNDHEADAAAVAMGSILNLGLLGRK